MFGLGGIEIIVIGIVAVLLFGSKLPSIARSFGQSITEFKKGVSSITDETKNFQKEVGYDNKN